MIVAGIFFPRVPSCGAMPDFTRETGDADCRERQTRSRPLHVLLKSRQGTGQVFAKTVREITSLLDE